MANDKDNPCFYYFVAMLFSEKNCEKMLSFLKKPRTAFVFTALILVPMFFLMPLPFGGSAAHAITIGDILTGIGSFIGKAILALLLPLIYLFFVVIPRWFFLLSGIVFDTFIAFSLSSEVIKNQDFVNQGWIIMRDISNTFFIFILLYIAIATILQLAGGQTKKLLVTLIMVALLMNFSNYITKFVIDVGNVFALEFYVNIGVEGLAYIDLPDIKPRSISAGFLSAFDVEKFNSSSSLLDKILNPGKTTFFYILLGIMYLVATFVFLTAGFLFLARVVAFWLLMILAPLAFFSYILPYTRGKIWGRWSSELVGQTFFAPIFLFFVYLTMILATSVGGIFKTTSASSSDPDIALMIELFVTFLTFFALITLLLFGLKIAKSMSGELGASMLKLGGAATGGLIAGGAYVGRNTVGRTAKYMEDKLGDRMDKSKVGRGLKAVMITPLANSSFDVRASKMAQHAQSTVGGINLGSAGGAGGFSKVAKDNERQNRETYNRLKNNPEAQAAFVASLRRTGSSLDKDGTAKGLNPDVHTKKLMQSLSSGQRTALIASAKNPEDKLYLSKLNEGLGKSFVSDADKDTLKDRNKKIREGIADGSIGKDEGEAEISENEEKLANLGSDKAKGDTTVVREPKTGGVGTVPNPKVAARGKFQGTSGSSAKGGGKR